MENGDYLHGNCPQCGGGIEFPAQGAGERVDCPHCQTNILLTRPKRRLALPWKWVVMVSCTMICGTVGLIYADLRARLGPQQRQEQPKVSPDGTRAETEAAAQMQTLLKSLEKDVQELRQTNAILLSRQSNQQAFSDRRDTQDHQQTRPPPAQSEQIAPPQQSAQRIRVNEILGQTASWLRCRTDVGEILIAKLPAQVGQYWAEVNKQKAEIADLSTRLGVADQVARRANAVALTSAGGDAAYVNSAMNQRARANLMTEDVRDGMANLQNMRATLSNWQRVENERTTILAVPARRRYAGLDVWNYAGMASSVR